MTPRPTRPTRPPTPPTTVRPTLRLSYEEILRDPAASLPLLRDRFVVLSFAELREAWDRLQQLVAQRARARDIRIATAAYHDKQRIAQKVVGTMHVLEAMLDDPDAYTNITVDEMRAVREAVMPSTRELSYDDR